MPFYHKLKIRERDSAKDKKEKRRVAKRLLELRKALAEHIKHSAQDHETGHAHDSSRLLRLATWNIREFDSNKFGRRREESYYYIAEILSTFDLIAIQEVREDLSALRRVKKILGPDWDYIATDVTEGTGGNRERMVFIYNTTKVWFRNIAGELVLPASQRITHLHEQRMSFDQELRMQLPSGKSLKSPADVKTRKRGTKRYLSEEVVIDLPDGSKAELPAGSKLVLPKGYEVKVARDGSLKLPTGTRVTLDEKGKNKEVMINLPKGAIVGDSVQFARTPNMVAFQSGWLKINLCTVHIYYGSDAAGMERRKEEIRRLTKFLAKRAASDKDSDSDSFFVVLGDFNIVGKEHDTMKALRTNDFEVPEALFEIPEGSNVDRSKSYDQIAYWTDPKGVGFAKDSVTRFEVHRAGIFDFFKTVYRHGDDDEGGKDEAFYRATDDYESRWKYKDWRTFQISDHLPMWIELRIDFGDEYLEQIAK